MHIFVSNGTITSCFFRNLLLGEQWDLRNRYLHIQATEEWKKQPRLDEPTSSGQAQDKLRTSSGITPNKYRTSIMVQYIQTILILKDW
ncbi:MAG: hypothetical protein IJ916_04515 [Paludibacteraceae bacterium]|nr:hypothetical protein [Paludibacteraceae bacterium]